MSALARSLLALACFALLLAAGSARGLKAHAHAQASSLPFCEESLSGSATSDVVILDKVRTAPYQKLNDVNSEDQCFKNNKRLVGAMVTACDELGPPAPSILSLDSLSQVVSCSTRECRSGITVTITQYCGPL